MLEQPRPQSAIDPAECLQPKTRSRSGDSGLADCDSSVTSLDEHTARRLVDIYLLNTQSFFDLASPEDLGRDLDIWYRSPKQNIPSQCRLFLVFAIGSIYDRESGPAGYSRAGLCYRSALRTLNSCNEVPGDELVAIWALRAVYMMSVSRRNDAWDYLRTAIGLALSAGMHAPRQTKQMTMQLQGGSHDDSMAARQQALQGFADRCKVWKSLFVLDSFLSALVGRPHAVPDASCS